MKQIWPNYLYSPTTNVLTLTGLNIDRDQLLLVSAPERGRIMYNFADSATTASAFTAGANTGLTLVASTAGLTTTASLIIYFDDQTTAVTVGNFPATQPVSIASVTIGSLPQIAGTVTVGNSVNINSLPAIIINPNDDGSGGNNGPVVEVDSGIGIDPRYMVVAGGFTNNDNQFRALTFEAGSALLVGGTVTVGNTVTIGGGTVAIGAGISQIGSVTASISNFPATQAISIASVTIGNSITIGSLPLIAGTVTANVFGYDTINVENSRIGVFGVGDRGVLEVNGINGEPVPISGTVTVGNTVTIAGSVTIGAGISQIGSVTASISNFPATQTISGTVTANTFAVQGTAVTTSNFTSTIASTLLAGFNATREVLSIFNEGAGNLHICPGATCTTIAYQVRLSSGDYYEVPNHQTTITHSAVFATAGTARVTEVS